MIAEMLFGVQQVSIGPVDQIEGGGEILLPGFVTLDCSENEHHIDNMDVTEFPVEVGVAITDHVRMRPAAIQLEGMITNSPIVFLSSVLNDSPVLGLGKGRKNRVDDAYSALQKWMTDGIVGTVITTLRVYYNMVITDMAVDRNAEFGNALKVNLSLREIIKTSLMTTSLPVPKDVVNNATKDQGQQQTEDKSDDAPTQSQAEDVSTIMKLIG